MYTPYEIVLGMKPRLALDALMGPVNVEPITKERYVSHLIDYLKRVHKYVGETHVKIRDEQLEAKARRLGVSEPFEVGDYVMFKANETLEYKEGVTAPNKYRDRWRNMLYQIVATHGASSEDTRNIRSYTICDANSGQTHNLGFSQPVTADRLCLVEVAPLTRPIDDGPTRILLNDRQGTVTAQSLDGRVKIQFEGEEHDEWYDLTHHSYRWLT